MITNAAIRAPADTPGTSPKLCQSQNSADVDNTKQWLAAT